LEEVGRRLKSEQNDEECDATNDHSSNVAGSKKEQRTNGKV
jgi:hypothetical protein